MHTGTLLEFLNMGGGEIMVILLAVLLLFGGKKLPELARGLGKGIRDFKDASEGVKREIHRNINSVGIVDDVKSVVDDLKYDLNNDRHHPSESTSSYAHTDSEAKAGIDLEKKEEVVASTHNENPRIETDKTQL